MKHAYTRPWTWSRALLAILLGLTLAGCDLANAPLPGDGDDPSDGGSAAVQACLEAMEPPETTEASESERTLACLIATHADQGRPEMSYDADLGQIARDRADDMAQRGYYGGADHPYPPHVDHDGFGPDYFVCVDAYEPTGWDCTQVVSTDPQRNTTESIGMGTASLMSTAEQQFDAWLGSDGHRRHVLAEHVAFQSATRYGIGHAQTDDSPDEPGSSANYWVFLAAPPPAP